MNRVPISSRRQLFRLLTAGAVSFPFTALADKGGGGHHCFLKGTKISTAKGERPVQDLKIGDEVHTLRARDEITESKEKNPAAGRNAGKESGVYA